MTLIRPVYVKFNLVLIHQKYILIIFSLRVTVLVILYYHKIKVKLFFFIIYKRLNNWEGLILFQKARS